MVKNLLETGTPFDYKGVDFSKADGPEGLPSVQKVQPNLPSIEVGEQDIPDRDFKYIDKAPTFEDED